jgi:hypothetical protein
LGAGALGTRVPGTSLMAAGGPASSNSSSYSSAKSNSRERERQEV